MATTKTERFLKSPKWWGRPETFDSSPRFKEGYSTPYTEIDERSIPGGEMISHTRRKSGKNAEKTHEWGKKGIKNTGG